MAKLDNTKFHTQGYLVASTAADANATVLYTCPNNFSAIVRYLVTIVTQLKKYMFNFTTKMMTSIITLQMV